MNYTTALPQQTELRSITVEWEKTFGGNVHDFGATVYPTQDGGYIVGGDTESFGTGERDILLIKSNSSMNKPIFFILFLYSITYFSADPTGIIKGKVCYKETKKVSQRKR